MQFYQLYKGDPFLLNGEKYEKIPEKRISCCKIEYNALKIDSDKKREYVVINPKQEVTPVKSHDE